MLGHPRAGPLGRDRQRGKRADQPPAPRRRHRGGAAPAQRRSTCMPWTAAAGACGPWSSSPTPARWSAMTTGTGWHASCAGSAPRCHAGSGPSPSAGPRRWRNGAGPLRTTLPARCPRTSCCWSTGGSRSPRAWMPTTTEPSPTSCCGSCGTAARWDSACSSPAAATCSWVAPARCSPSACCCIRTNRPQRSWPA